MKDTYIKRQIIRAINQSRPNRPHDLQLEDVSFDAPELLLQGACNSRVRVTAKDTSVIAKGTCRVHYNRRRIDDLLRDVRVPGESTDYASSLEVIEALVEHYGFPLDPNDFVFAGIFPNTPVLIQPKDTCLGFFQNFTASLPFMGSNNAMAGRTLLETFTVKVGWFEAPGWWRGFFRDAKDETPYFKGAISPSTYKGVSVRDINAARDDMYGRYFLQFGLTTTVTHAVGAVTIDDLPLLTFRNRTMDGGIERLFFSNDVTDIYRYLDERYNQTVTVKLWT